MAILSSIILYAVLGLGAIFAVAVLSVAFMDRHEIAEANERCSTRDLHKEDLDAAKARVAASDEYRALRPRFHPMYGSAEPSRYPAYHAA